MLFEPKCRFHLALTLVVVSVHLWFCHLARAADPQGGLTLTSPLDRQVFQRGADDSGQAVIAGTQPAGVENIEARAVLADDAPRGKTVGWAEATVLQYGKTYQVRYLPGAKICLDGRADEPDWSRAKVEKDFIFPWKPTAAPATEFRALCDDRHLYFTFQVQDADIVVLDKLRDEEDEVFEDRAEMYFSPDNEMKNYFCMEIDSRGRVFDYRGSYYRQLDPKWNCAGVEAKSSSLKEGYVVEGRIPLASLEAVGLPPLRPGAKFRCGLYRAEFSHDRSGRPVVQRETIHNRGRRLDGPPPLEEWMSWVDPKTNEPDFHIPSSLGFFEIVP
jgi:hypothetical protein